MDPDPFNPNSPGPFAAPQESPAMPDTGPNRDLPPISPLKARSTLAAILSVLALIGPLLPASFGEIGAEILPSGDAIQRQTETVINALNALIGVASMLWFWWERRAPHFRLSLRGQ